MVLNGVAAHRCTEDMIGHFGVDGRQFLQLPLGLSRLFKLHLVELVRGSLDVQNDEEYDRMPAPPPTPKQ